MQLIYRQHKHFAVCLINHSKVVLRIVFIASFVCTEHRSIDVLLVVVIP